MSGDHNMNCYGGPAFPLQSIGPDFAPGYAGMTLRDYFAAKAMVLGWKVFDEGYSPDDLTPEAIAKFSYQMADAMLAARKNTEDV